MDRGTLTDLLALAVRAADEASCALEANWDDWRRVDGAGAHDLKLAADRRAEAMLIGRLVGASGLPLLAEETGWTTGGPTEDGLYWVVDPLDGSVNYRSGNDLCCVAIALCHDDRPVASVIHRLGRSEVYTALCPPGGEGRAATCDGRPLRVAGARAPAEAVLGTSLSSRADYDAAALARFGQDLRDWRKVRMLGSGSVSLAWVAAGHFDAYREVRTMPWDVLPGWAVVEAAGGGVRVSGPDLPRPGEQPLPVTVRAANPDLLAAL